ncbi:Polycomb protein suz12 [Orchesella cincta]|uniref:Polycomb protein suz12 n=1 Tax=Orchesella cincta TaxID=48709 RepID=A0A1D2MIZ4_ORCCI|nr:Polycomb protein suz12 [Orchesella cincta]
MPGVQNQSQKRRRRKVILTKPIEHAVHNGAQKRRKRKIELDKSVEPTSKKLKRGRPKGKAAVKSSPNPNRQYYHASTNLPIKPNEKVDSDSTDDEVYQELNNRSIDKLRGVTPLQKDFMKLWNAHRQKTREVYRGISHLKDACSNFVDEHKVELKDTKMYREFMFHLTTLHEKNLMTRGALTEVVNRAHKIHEGDN